MYSCTCHIIIQVHGDHSFTFHWVYLPYLNMTKLLKRGLKKFQAIQRSWKIWYSDSLENKTSYCSYTEWYGNVRKLQTVACTCSVLKRPQKGRRSQGISHHRYQASKERVEPHPITIPDISMRGLSSRFKKNCLFSRSSSFSLDVHTHNRKDKSSSYRDCSM